MDIKRPSKSKLKKKIRTAILIVIGVVAIGGITYGLAKLSLRRRRSIARRR